MQTTLLSLAVALILALVAALVGPYFIDWGTYRSLFEKEATRLTGLDVHVRGQIDARLLPSPRLQLHNIEIGSSDIRAAALTVEFALGPLMRGEWRASELHLSAPEIHLGLNRAGSLDAPSVALNFDPDALSIERLGIEDGKAVISDATSGASLTLEKVWFNGDLRSLLGPVKGEGAVTIGGELYPFRLSTGRATNERALRVRLNVDPVNTPLNIETDGMLSLAGGKPQFQGTWSLARPVGIAPREAAALVTQPWRLGGKIKATPASALMEQLDFQYGSGAEALKLSGTAELKFGERPRFDGVLSARQVDFDKLAGEDDAAHAPPAVTLRRLASLAGQAFRPPIPISIGVGIDVVTLGGADLQNVRGDISTAAGGWTLDRFEFRAPGFTDVRLSGRLAFGQNGAVFNGPAEVNANDPNALTAWLEGRKDQPRGPPRPLRLRGDVTLGNEKIAVERLTARFDRGTVSGQFAYTFATPKSGARIDASLSAPELDLDAANAFGKAVLAGSALERPSQAALALDIGRATYAGIETGRTVARLQYDGDGVNIEQLTIDNFGGANLSGHGQIALAPTPHGNLALDLDAHDLAGVTALIGRYAPEVSARLVAVMPSLAPARLHASLTVGETAPGKATFNIGGTAGGLRGNLDGEANGDLAAIDGAKVQMHGKLDADDGRVLGSLSGLDRAVAINKQAGSFAFNAAGPAFGELKVDGRMTAGGFDGAANGTMLLAPGKDPQALLKVRIAHADLAPLRDGAPVPVAMAGNVKLDGQTLSVTDMTGTIAGSALRGNLAATFGNTRKLSGNIDVDSIDVSPLLAAVAGMPAGKPAPSGWSWSSDPFGSGLLAGYEGSIAIKAMRASLAPNVVAREWRAKLRLIGDGVALDDITATALAGNLTGSLAMSRTADGLSARGKLALVNADLGALWPQSPRPPAAGRLGLQIELEGAGRSPVALIGSLHGAGKFSLSSGQFAGLDPRVFAAVTRAVDQGLPIEASKVDSLAGSALESGRLSVRKIDGDLAASTGQIRLSNVTAKGEGADVSAEAALDLTSGTIDARVVLTGVDTVAGARPDIFMALRGPVDAPAKSVDVSALTGWLTLRAVDRQSKKLEAIEANAPPQQVQSEPPVSSPPAVAAPPPAPSPPHVTPPGRPPHESNAPRKPASARRVEQAPALPPPISILPPVNPPVPAEVPRRRAAPAPPPIWAPNYP